MPTTENKALQDDVVSIARRLIPIKSISPESGGEGEKARADEICRILTEFGYPDFKRYDYKDTHGATRSNVLLKIPGKSQRTLWILSHIDTVPPGSDELWSKPPFEVTIEDGKIYGRGTADNGEGVLSTLLLLKHLKKEDLTYSIGLAYVADEEVGSKYGVQKLMGEGIFTKDDLVIVPDSGTMEGLEIEIAEKSTLWLKFSVSGMQGHASTPNKAVNAAQESMKFGLSLVDALHRQYPDEDETFDYPPSSFEITKREKNVDNVNTIPGLDVFYLDSRVLPKYPPEDVLAFIRNHISEFEKGSKAKITMEIMNEEHTPPTSVDSEIYKILSSAIRTVQGKEPKPIGIGGGTVAAFFRNAGIDAVVWGMSDPDVYHQPDEFIAIDHLIKATEIYKKIIYS